MEIIISLSNPLQQAYPEAKFGSLIVKNVPNKKENSALEQKKRTLEDSIRNKYKDSSMDKTLKSYKNHFKKWGKTYPIEFQIQTIQKGKNLPTVSVLVDAMFHAELKNGILTSGHDLDLIKGDLTFEVTKGTEKYQKINGRDQLVKKEDIYLKDDEGILANVLYGPAKRTTISMKTKNALYLAWCPKNIVKDQIITHLNEIKANISLCYSSLKSEIGLIES